MKDWKKIIGYFIPIVALVIANIAKVDDPEQIEGALEIIASGVFGLLAAIGVYKTHDKNAEK
ncbi:MULTISPECIES: hypothetical protein [Geobacillus]|jgi:hypothetical protein|uniref:hypothetical protein n=1 Tax=Geobacillus TaxID=129337 RepID=UPI00017E5AF0|nr:MULTISPECIES: hypothetical protein [Geobacillus]MED0662182.1 hypothetical protein [Geobacillus thermodenitrificans]OQP08949.1 hypothetical protein B1691_13010 [Geobacillus sp. 47C-IIb]PJW19303.1 hypothetical protein CV632_17000 [Geobacillus thermodenitrificans]QNU32354.1 hypothetical protein IC804_06410 [Geobacillus sp. 47C-IIb]